MNIEYHKEYSHQLGRDMEFKVYGHAGKPCLFFPCKNGRFYDFENFKMIDYWADYIEQGRVQVFSVDTIDIETWSAKDRNPHDRISRHEQWFWYVTEELVPRVLEINAVGNNGAKQSGIMVFGASMGAMHAGNFYFRRPDLFDMCLALSGIYDSRDGFGDYMEPLIYENSPIDFLRNMPAEHPYMKIYNDDHHKAVFCVGQGAWEDELKESTARLKQVLEEKGISAWVDFWGYDVNHDWNWWYVQVRYFLPFLLGDI